MTIEKQAQAVVLNNTIEHLEMSLKFLSEDVSGLYVEYELPENSYVKTEQYDIFKKKKNWLEIISGIDKQEIIDFIKSKYEIKLAEYKKYYDEL